MRIATDVGGTFTDLVYYDIDKESGKVTGVQHTKVDSTPPRFDTGILNAIAKAGLDLRQCELFVHATTAVINAITERKGAKTALITTRGFRDVLEIGRGNRPALFNFRCAKPVPFVPRRLRREVTERMSYLGQVITPLTTDDLSETLSYFKGAGVEVIAICLLHAYANPEHEVALAEEINNLWPDITVVPSHAVTREWREYERSSTTVLSGFVTPVARAYLEQLEQRLADNGFSGTAAIVKSNGGVDDIEVAKEMPIAIMESGPASGVLGAGKLGAHLGIENIIALDIGGTTAKCSLIDRGKVRVITQYDIGKSESYAGYPVLIPGIDIVEIGQGGGSIAWVDPYGKLHVGPTSAGAVPGPASYGRGGEEFTTTDANLLLGRIGHRYFLGGTATPNLEGARAASARLAQKLNVTPEEAARGVVRLANNGMVNALKLVSLNRGHDPRDFTLFAFGGGGGLHAAALARDLGTSRVVVPYRAAVFSAFSMLLCDRRRDYVRTRVTPLREERAAEIARTFSDLETQARADVAVHQIGSFERLYFERYLDLRYHGQDHTVKIPLQAQGCTTETIAAARAMFIEAHQREYTYKLNNPVELLNFHLVALQEVAKPAFYELNSTGSSLDRAIVERRTVDFDVDGVCEAIIYEWQLLEPGDAIVGPALVEDPTTTVVLPPRCRLSVDRIGNLNIRVM